MSCSSAARLSQRRWSVREGQLLGDQVAEQRHALAVAAGVRALGVDHLREGGRDIVEIILVDHGAVLRRLEREDRLLQVVGAQRRPELLACRDARERRRQRWDRTSCRRAARSRALRRRRRSRSGTRRRPAPSARCARRPGWPRRAGRAAGRRRPSARRDSGCRARRLRRSASCARCRRRDGSASRSARVRFRRCSGTHGPASGTAPPARTFKPVCESTKRSACGRLPSIVLASCLKVRSSVRNSRQMRAALLLHPRSFSSRV